MDFDDSPEQAEFRAEARDWLAKQTDILKKPEGKITEQDELKRAKAWQARKADARYAQITWPEEMGGRGATPIEAVIFEQEEARYPRPQNFFAIGLGMCIPTLMAWATEDQKSRYVEPALRGEEIWCQLFSEPAAGSDLAGIRTRAVRDGDEWVINGQKIWTSGAHLADFGIIVTRTDPSVPKHKGLTFFFLDMKSPGIEIRPIKQVSGGKNFNEVYFTDVRIPDEQRLGDVGEGWKVSLTTLMNERLSISESSQGGVKVDDLMRLARAIEGEDGPAISDKQVRGMIADWYAKYTGLRNGRYRTMTALSKGERPGPEASINKAVFASMLQDMATAGLDMMDMAGVLIDPRMEEFRDLFMGSFLSSPGLRIAGGTDEILRNIIAERVLGLPGDIRVDKDVAFKDLPSGRA